jgi:hypothetical protein
MTIPLTPLEDTIVPDTLITPEELAAKAALTHPAFVPLDGKVIFSSTSYTLLCTFPPLFRPFLSVFMMYNPLTIHHMLFPVSTAL